MDTFIIPFIVPSIIILTLIFLTRSHIIQNRELKLQLDNLTDKLAQKCIEYEKQSDTIKVWSKELNDLNDKLFNKEVEIGNLEYEIKCKDKEKETIIMSLNTYKDNVEKLEKKVIGLENERSSLAAPQPKRPRKKAKRKDGQPS